MITSDVDIIQHDLTTGNLEFNRCELCNRKWELLPYSLTVSEGTGDLEGTGGYPYMQFFLPILPVDFARVGMFTGILPLCVSESN